MANFQGKQSLNGLHTFSLFTAPAAGIYFLNGQLNLPQLTTAGGASAVVATVYNGVGSIYAGTAGASGFQIPAFTCAADDVITVVLSSSASPDQVSNAVSGQVVYGNAY